MFRRIYAAAATAALACSLSASPVLAAPYYFSAGDFVAAAGTSTPATVGGATFSSPSDPGAFTFGPNGGTFTDLGPYVLSSAGVTATLDITFATAQTGVTFDFALGDFFASGGSDILTVTTSAGTVAQFTAAAVSGDFYPEGLAFLDNVAPFTSIALSSAYPIALAPVPEPASMALLGSGLLGLLAARRRCQV
jgi:hypothetical protein